MNKFADFTYQCDLNQQTVDSPSVIVAVSAMSWWFGLLTPNHKYSDYSYT